MLNTNCNEMTLPTNLQTNSSNNVGGGGVGDKTQGCQSTDVAKLSPNSSPRSSPRPSPRPQHKRDHSRSSKDSQTSNKSESAQNVETSSNNSRTSQISFPDNIFKEKKDQKSSKKKNFWYNVLYPTYKSRSEDFKRIFKDVPDDERLVVDYSCALQKEILVHGRLYITQNYLCFYANIFGWETTVTLQWKDITAITKEKTALVIPNAILLTTESDKYFLTSFGARDKTYLMMFRVWQNALLDQPMSSQEMWQWVHQCYGDELGLTSDDEDYVAPGTGDDMKARGTDSFSEDCNELESSFSTLQSSTVTEDTKHENGNIGAELQQQPSTDTQLPTDMSDSTESDADQNETSPVCSVSHDGRQLVCETYPMHVDQLFTLLFTSSKFLLDFHNNRRTTNFTPSAWVHDPATGRKTRIVTCTVAIGSGIGPKSSNVTETQIMLPCSKPGTLYAIDIETMNAGIPYAESFYVYVHYCIEKIAEAETRISAFAQIKYKKTVWGLVRGFIEKNVWQGLEDFYGSMAKALHQECQEIIHPIIKRKSRRRRKVPVNGGEVEEEQELLNHTIHVPMLSQPQQRSQNYNCIAWMVFIMLILLVLLNVALYYKLWMLEDAANYRIIDLHVIKNPPSSHEEWLKLLQKQESVHSIEMQKWQKVLKTAVKLLRQTEESLSELQHSIHPTSERIISMLQNDENKIENKDEL